jgi:CRISPR/Cas system-associated protein Cas10 (large subunit of type III CRISPR-Cas system)
MLLITDGLPRGLGYVEVDNRASGLPPGRNYFEADTYTCTHCSVVVVLNPERKRERYKCHGCNHHICDTCAAVMVAGGKCETMQEKFEKHVEQVLRQSASSLIHLP